MESNAPSQFETYVLRGADGASFGVINRGLPARQTQFVLKLVF
jgi:hypothetical protein